MDRINLHFKHHIDVPFSDKEKVWVQKQMKLRLLKMLQTLQKSYISMCLRMKTGENQEQQNASGDDENNQVDAVPSPSEQMARYKN